MQPKGLFKFLRLEGFFQNVTEYIENRVAIAKLDAKQKVADIGSTIAALIPAALFGFFALTFLSVALALALGDWLDGNGWGFLIVGVLYLVAAGVMFSQRDAVWLKKKIVDGSTKFLKEKPQDTKQAEEDAETAGYHAPQVEHKKIIFEEPPLKDREPSPNPATTRENYTPVATVSASSDDDRSL